MQIKSTTAQIRIGCRRTIHPPVESKRTIQVREAFGLVAREETAFEIGEISLPLAPGKLIAFVGPSGSGKTSLLDRLEAQSPNACNVDRMRFSPDHAVIDHILPQAPLANAARTLTACALSEPRLWLRAYPELSEGEKFRARLARALGIVEENTKPPLIIDEFASGLHCRIARAIAFNLRRLVTQRRLTAVVAATREDILPDLAPDAVIRLADHETPRVYERCTRRAPFSIGRALHIEQGTISDYQFFANMHYRPGDALGFVDRVFVLRNRRGEALGIAVYGYPPAELALRNRALDGRFARDLKLLNKEMRILRRIVIHPDLRGCGLGHRLVSRTIKMLNVPFVECLAAFGDINPILERAGMKRIGVCALPPKRGAVVAELERLDVNPMSHDFVRDIASRPAVREVVADEIKRWYRGASGQGAARVDNQSPMVMARIFRGLISSRPVYYLWRRHAAGRARRRSPVAGARSGAAPATGRT